MMDTNEYAEFLGKVATGSYDSHLQTMIDTLRERSKYVQRMEARLITEGDRVRVTRIRPRYFDGLTGVVVERSSESRIKVQLDNVPFNARRYVRPDGTISFPATSLELEKR